MNATPVSKEEVRLLAIEYGIRETARKTGLNANTILSWSKRYSWFTQPPSVVKQNGNAISAIKPSGEVVMDELADNERETRLGLSKFARHAIGAINKSVHPVRYTKEAHDIAKVAGITHKWGDDTAKGNHFTLNTLNINSLTVDGIPEPTVDTD